MSVSYEIAGGLTHLSGNAIQITLTASVARVNHKLLLKVICKTMQDQELAGSPFVEENTPNSSLSAKFNISGLVDYPAQNSFTFPIIGGCNPHDLLAIKVTFEVGEIWIDENGDYNELYAPASDTIRVLRGKMKQYELSLLNKTGKSFASEYIQNGKFLTHQPDYQKIEPNQICMLWFLGKWTNENHPFDMNLKVTTDRKEFTLTRPNTYWSITGLIEFEFSVFHQGGYEQLEWGEKHMAYDFWLSDETGEVSEHRHYIIDWDPYEQSEFVYATNPFSGIDLYWFTGHKKEGLTTESEMAVRAVPVGAGPGVSSIKTISVSGQRTWEINTGYRSRDELTALRDLLESKEIWIVDKTTNALLPVIVESGDFQFYDTLEDLQSLSIKFKEAHND